MDLEGLTHKRIIQGHDRDEIIAEIVKFIGEFKDWESQKKEDFSSAVYDEVQTSLGYGAVKDAFLSRLLESPRSGVSMGEFGVGSRGIGDFKVHRDIAEIIGGTGLFVGPEDQDDAGVVEARGGFVTISVDGIHSRLSRFPFLAGFHATRATLRDVYVMGSRPIALLSDLHLADDGDLGKLYDFTAGVSAVSDSARIPVAAGSTLRVGGDLVFGDRLVASVGAVGVSKTRPLARRFAETGDIILLTLGRGGGTICTTAIYGGNFEVIKETLNLDFIKSMETIFQAELDSEIHAMTDVTNGGLRGDALEISKTSKLHLAFDEKQVKKSISSPVLKMLDEHDIDCLGVSTDSLMLILPKESAKKVIRSLKKITPVFEVGLVEPGNGASIVKENGVAEALKPLFREAAYTKVKKVVGESIPEELDEMSAAIEEAKEEAIKKKEEVKRWIARN
jgi:hydrogenase expression/formation protein